MFYALSWFVVVVLLAVWSLAAWALNAVAVWIVSNSGAVSGAASDVGSIRLPDWLGAWVPPEVAQLVGQMLAGLRPMVDSLLQTAPALAGGVTVATWLVWFIGSALLLMLGAGTHLLIALWRPRESGAGPNTGPSPAAD
jgi:hypothetical protein